MPEPRGRAAAAAIASAAIGASDAPLRLGTRGSALALAQSGQVACALEAAHPGLRIELVPIVTRGDRLAGDLAKLGGKGLFTQELERGLLDGSLDLAVHSLKDLPVALPEGLTIAAFPHRADPRDVLVSEAASDLDGLPPGAVVLTGSLRRRAQILLRRPDLRVEALRGNVDTRLRRWRESGAGGLVLASAGLARLGFLGTAFHALPPEVLLPAPGQGTLALEVRRGGRAEILCRVLNDAETAAAAAAERRVVAAFGGDCTLPLAAWARWEAAAGDGGGASPRLRLSALLVTPDGRRVARGEAAGADPAAVADTCIAALRADGAEEVLERVRGERR